MIDEKRLGDVLIGGLPLREWTLTVQRHCYGHGDYGPQYVAEPLEFSSYTGAVLIKDDEVHHVIEKDPELIRLVQLGLWAEKHGIPALKKLTSYGIDEVYTSFDGSAPEKRKSSPALDALAQLPKETFMGMNVERDPSLKDGEWKLKLPKEKP